jgi:hypothetical protein
LCDHRNSSSCSISHGQISGHLAGYQVQVADVQAGLTTGFTNNRFIADDIDDPGGAVLAK